MTQSACLSEYVALAHKLADSARPIIRKHFRTRLDIVPQIPIIEGAGGVVTDWNGDSLGDEQHFKTVLMAANPTLLAAALELLQRR